MSNFLTKLFQFGRRSKAEKLRNKPVRSLERFKKAYPQFEIGNHCYGVPIIKFKHPDATLKIGRFCSIAKNVEIYLGGMHRTDWVSTYPFHAFFEEAAHITKGEITNGNVMIGNDVWLCQNATILSGISIGDGAVIANGAVVTKDVAAYSIVGGNPAKHIRWRFDEETRNTLLVIKWWEWPEHEILGIVDLICTHDLAAFFEYAKNRASEV